MIERLDAVAQDEADPLSHGGMQARVGFLSPWDPSKSERRGPFSSNL